MWFLDRAHPGAAACNVPLLMRWNEPVDVAALRQALHRLTTWHEALRTTYRLRGDRPVQQVRPPRAVEVSLHHSAVRPDREDVLAHGRTPFDLTAGPLLRCDLWHGAPEGDTLLLTLHHIAFDGWSLAALFDDLLAAYDAALADTGLSVPRQPTRYTDFATWEHESWSQRDVEGRSARRAEELSEATDSPLFPGRGPRTTDVRAGGHLTFPIPGDVWQATGVLATRLRATPFVVLLSAFQEVLRRWSGAADFIVGTVMANRPRPALEGVVGCFVNTVPLRCRPAPEMSFEELCLQSRTEAFRALAHQDLPFDRVTALTAVKRGAGRGRLVEVAFGVQNMPAPRTTGNTRWQQPELLPTGTARYDLLFLVEERADGAVGTIEYDLALCSGETAARFRDSFLALLAAAVEAPASPLSVLPLSRRTPGIPVPGTLVGPRRDLGQTSPPLDRTLLDAISARLGGEPDAVAVSAGGERLTRGQLDDWSWAIAQHVGRAVGVVPVLAARGPALTAAWLGTLRSGNAYVPLGLDTPPERLEYILGDLDARIMLADREGAEVIRRTNADIRVLDLRALRHVGPVVRSSPDLSGDDTAVVVYTSGTTGRPKGVPVSHRGLANTVAWWAEDARLSSADRLLCVVGTSFDPATFEVFRALVSGAELLFADDLERKDGRALRRLLGAASVVSMTPGLLRAVLDSEDGSTDLTAPALRLVYLGGEKLTRSLAAECEKRWNVTVRNVYGPTEVSCTSLSAEVDPADPQAPPIGTPIWNTRAYVLGPAGEELPPGVPGELYLAGAGVSKGYVGRPELTARAFLPDPFAPQDAPCARMYRTGDRVLLRPDGCVEYLGRADDQTKILGNRIEPAEVGALVEEGHDAVLSAAVAAEGDPARLVAYVVLSDIANPPTHDDVVRPLLRWLPTAVLPGAVYPVDALPMTANDKTDFQALRLLRSAPLAKGVGRRAGLGTTQRWASEQFLAALRTDGRDALSRSGDEAVPGPDDDFFALGGHSLLAVRMLAAIEREHGVSLSLGAFLNEPTVAGLAELFDTAPSSRTTGVTDPAEGRHPATAIQQRMVFMDRLAGQRAAYLAPTLMEFSGSVNGGTLARALDHILDHHPALRSRFFLDRSSRQVFYTTDGSPAETRIREWTEGEEQLRRYLDEFCWAPFDLADKPPVRAEIIRISDRLVLALVMHHLVTDGWAQRLLLRQLGQVYRSFATSGLPRLPPAIHPSALADRPSPADVRAADRTEVLLARLRGAPTDIALPHDRERPAVQDTMGAVRTRRLATETSARLREVLADQRATVSMAAPALMAVALAGTTDQRDFVFALPWVGRDSAAAAEAVAMLIKTLALRVDLRATSTWRDLLSAVRNESLVTYQYADVPFEALVAKLDPGRGLNRPPLTPVLVTAVTDPPTVPDLGRDIWARHLPLPGLRVKYELELTLRVTDDSFDVELAYATALFDAPSIDALLDEVVRAVGRLASQPDHPVLPPRPGPDSSHTDRPGKGLKTGDARP